jgi:hypothetical protein
MAPVSVMAYTSYRKGCHRCRRGDVSEGTGPCDLNHKFKIGLIGDAEIPPMTLEIPSSSPLAPNS